MNSTLTIMVSSTFYDLRQIREDLHKFISVDLGYTALLSEFPSFPIDPDLNTVENCRSRVEKHADILVLVIGGRYGSIDKKADKSVTNLEYLAAQQKGIPIYVYVEKTILAILPIWKDNRSGNYTNVVDTTRVFEFIEELRSQKLTWTFAFETASEIVSSLRFQLAHLFNESLALRMRLAGTTLPEFLNSLKPASLRIALEKPAGWEYRLFFQAWIDELEDHDDFLREYAAGLAIDDSEWVPLPDSLGWTLTRIHEISNLVSCLTHLVNVSAQEAFGKPGMPGDIQYIAWVSRMVGRVLGKVLAWARRIRSVRLDPPFNRLGPEMALMSDDLINKLQQFPRESLRSLEEALLLPRGDTPRTVRMMMELTLANKEQYFKVFEEVRQEYEDGHA